MALENVSAALRMSMPEIIRQYLKTFELRQELEQMRAVTSLRKLPHWIPLRDTLVRRKARKVLMRSEAGRARAASVSAGASPDLASVAYIAPPQSEVRRKTGTE
jgi:hypothetical protein